MMDVARMHILRPARAEFNIQSGIIHPLSIVFNEDSSPGALDQ